MKFPHIYRIIPSLFAFFSFIIKLASISLFLSIILFNLNTIFFPENTEYTTIKINTLTSPNNYQSNLLMGKYLLKINYNLEALPYFLKAQNLYQNQKQSQPNFSAQSTEPIQIYNQIYGEKIYSEEQLNYWKKILTQIDLKDAYVQLYYYSTKLGDVNSADIYLSKALQIDPLLDKN